MTGIEIRNEHLHNGNGNSDKVYILRIYEDVRTGKYTLVTEWGRRGKSLRSQEKCTSQSLTRVENEFTKIRNEKHNGGYGTTSVNSNLQSMLLHRLKLAVQDLYDKLKIDEESYNKMMSLITSEDPESLKLVQEIINVKKAA